MCNPTESESGQLLTIQPCGWYLKLQSERDRLAGVVKGMEEQSKRTLEALRRAEAENAKLNKECEAWVVTFDAGQAREKALRSTIAELQCQINALIMSMREPFQRGGIWYYELDRKRLSLRTKDRAEAMRLFKAIQREYLDGKISRLIGEYRSTVWRPLISPRDARICPFPG